MKNFNYSLTNSDINTLLCTLSIMPTIEVDGVTDVQHDINTSCCLSAIEKLLNQRTDFHPNEVRVMAVSLSLADAILKDKISTNSETKCKLSQYIFSINRLLPIFDSIFI